jgi:Nucleotidyl transferase AbiEii toxin, Type IV TA system
VRSPANACTSGAKSALDPHQPVAIRPYIAEQAAGLDFAVVNVTTIGAGRTFWDKMVIAHGLRHWFERRGELRRQGERVSRHYYDLYCLFRSEIGKAALADRPLDADCVRHTRMFFDRADFDLALAKSGSFAIAPSSGMINGLARDYANTSAMIFGKAPTFDVIVASVREIDRIANSTI